MKIIIKIIIILLFVLLLGQLIYYNFNNNTNESNTNSTNEIEKIMVNEEGNVFTYNVIQTPDNIIEPDNFYLVERYSTGIISSEELRQAIEKFITEDVKTIHNQTTGKSINYKHQYYDNHTAEINAMGIYNSEDYSEISRQINLLDSSDAYENSHIDTNSYEEGEEGYIKFKLTITYKSGRKIEMYVNLAKDENTEPKIKFTSGV